MAIHRSVPHGLGIELPGSPRQALPVLHHGDCLQVLPTLPDGSVDLVVTSPPYNLGINYRSFDDLSLIHI